MKVKLTVELDEDDLRAINCVRASEGSDYDGEGIADEQEATEHFEGWVEHALEEAHSALDRYNEREARPMRPGAVPMPSPTACLSRPRWSRRACSA
jgi:hypothetical protein